MSPITIFKILTYLLIPVAILFGLMDIIMLFMALANPAILLIVFALACFVMYTFTSLRFLLEGIVNNQHCKSSLKDWIKVNAYVTLFLFIMFFMNSAATFFIDDITLRQTLSEMMDQQPELAGKISLDFFIKIFHVVSGIMFVISSLIIIHVLMNFKFLKRYQDLFSKE